MKKMMLINTKTLCFPLLCCMTLALVLLQNPAKCHANEIKIDIDVSPNVLNIGSKSTIVTVHTDIAYNLVIGASVTLNGVEIDWWKSDDRGNFVAKFSSNDIKKLEGLDIGAYNTLVLIGTTDEGSFRGEQDIMVRENTRSKK